MEEYAVQYAPLAVEDLRNTYTYIAYTLSEPTTALKQTDRIREGIRTLSVMPARHALVEWEPWRSLQIRKLPIDNYLAFYSVNAEARSVTVYRAFLWRQEHTADHYRQLIGRTDFSILTARPINT